MATKHRTCPLPRDAYPCFQFSLIKANWERIELNGHENNPGLFLWRPTRSNCATHEAWEIHVRIFGKSLSGRIRGSQPSSEKYSLYTIWSFWHYNEQVSTAVMLYACTGRIPAYCTNQKHYLPLALFCLPSTRKLVM